MRGRKFIPILGLCLLFFNLLTRAQSPSSVNKAAAINKSDTGVVGIRPSKDRLEHSVQYAAFDSIVYDADTKKLMLFQKANIEYDDIKVNADYIEYDQDTSTLMALEQIRRPRDSVDKPRLAQGSESSTFEKLQYNFKSKRALVENAYSQYGDGFILSQRVKRNNDESINGFRSIYTTCNAEVPHFGIAARKIKIIPNKVAVSGSANLVIEEIPTPLVLPFGLFPLKKGQKSGFKLPTYDVSQNLGFGIREGGYYFAINEHWDFLALADIYALGTWRAGFKTE
ncbi:MAG: LPS-assembly protein LptD [Chitinophagaceae bacterium]|nr:LPS-assembly protein LptD [Chitinophagaceae bacterium]